MVRRLLLVVLPSLAACSRTSVEIAPGVDMPLLNDGVSNRTVWLQAGGTGLDTACSYGDADQQRVGQAVRASGRPRSEVFVTTKIPCCVEDRFGTSFCQHNPQWKDTAAAIQHDLAMLDVEYIDLLLMHWPCGTVEATLETYSHMEAIVRAGKVRAIGVSNFNATLLEAFVPQTAIKPVVNQVSFSVAGHWHAENEWGSDDATLAKCKELGITLSAWAPLGGVSGIDVLHNPTVLAVAASHNVSSAQVALRWLAQQGIPAVTSTDSPAHAMSDLKVYDFELSEQEMALLASLEPPQALRGHHGNTLLV